MSVIKINKDDNLEKVKDKIISKVKNMRTNTKNNTDDTINKIGKMPHFIRAIVMGIFKFLDNHDLLPSSITKDDIYHASVLVSNLGSIGGGAIYHNLTDFGTNSLLVTIGDIHKEQVINEKGKIEIKDIVEFGITADERIADGFYLVKSAQLLQDYFNNPEVLKENVDEKYPR